MTPRRLRNALGEGEDRRPRGSRCAGLELEGEAVGCRNPVPSGVTSCLVLRLWGRGRQTSRGENDVSEQGGGGARDEGRVRMRPGSKPREKKGRCIQQSGGARGRGGSGKPREKKRTVLCKVRAGRGGFSTADSGWLAGNRRLRVPCLWAWEEKKPLQPWEFRSGCDAGSAAPSGGSPQCRGPRPGAHGRARPGEGRARRVCLPRQQGRLGCVSAALPGHLAFQCGLTCGQREGEGSACVA